ncbi:MAG: hypothetical protein AB7F86_18240 [Bdellovibrionales bacterium]
MDQFETVKTLQKIALMVFYFFSSVTLAQTPIEIRLFQSISAVGPMTIEEFAAILPGKSSVNRKIRALEGEFSALGYFNCGEYFGSAQVVGRGDVIVTARHNFKNMAGDRLLTTFESCEFTVAAPSLGQKRYKIVSAAFDPDLSISTADEDWAVAKLERVVEHAQPLAFVNNDYEPQVGQFFVQTTAFDSTFRRNELTPRSFQVCSVRENRSWVGMSMITDCQNGGGASGSAQLVQTEGKFQLISIAIRSNRAAGRSASAPLKGAFLQALKQMTGIIGPQ